MKFLMLAIFCVGLAYATPSKAETSGKTVEFTVKYDESKLVKASDFKNLLWRLSMHHRAKTSYGGCSIHMKILTFYPDDLAEKLKNTIKASATSNSNEPNLCDPRIDEFIDKIKAMDGITVTISAD